MTPATTLLALIPVLTATGRSAEIMATMAIPSFGWMVFAMITMFVVPVLCAAIEEWKIKNKNSLNLWRNSHRTTTWCRTQRLGH